MFFCFDNDCVILPLAITPFRMYLHVYINSILPLVTPFSVFLLFALLCVQICLHILSFFLYMLDIQVSQYFLKDVLHDTFQVMVEMFLKLNKEEMEELAVVLWKL
ncbi:hypothetical protein I3843_08G035900 [Carya illinoinensis]|nr:hypothetical protein I3843_08G035900 [Carya illinoinensis]